MTTITVGRGLTTLAEGTDYAWTPGPPVEATWDGPDAAWPLIAAATRATAEGHLDPDPAAPAETVVRTPHGDRRVVVEGSKRTAKAVYVETPTPKTVTDRLMAQGIATALGLPPARVMAANAAPQVIDLGRPTAVIPVDDPAALAGFKDGAFQMYAPGADAALAYAVTQRRPYAKAVVRVTPGTLATEPLVLATAAVHAINTGILRPDYPMTRFTCYPTDGEARIECRCRLEKTQAGPKWDRLRVGGDVASI